MKQINTISAFVKILSMSLLSYRISSAEVPLKKAKKFPTKKITYDEKMLNNFGYIAKNLNILENSSIPLIDYHLYLYYTNLRNQKKIIQFGKDFCHAYENGARGPLFNKYFSTIVLHLAEIYHKNNELENAIKYYELGIEHKIPECYIALARLYEIKLNDIDMAMSIYHQAIINISKKNPRDQKSLAVFNLATLYEDHKNDLLAAFSLFETAIQLNPQNALEEYKNEAANCALKIANLKELKYNDRKKAIFYFNKYLTYAKLNERNDKLRDIRNFITLKFAIDNYPTQTPIDCIQVLNKLILHKNTQEKYLEIADYITNICNIPTFCLEDQCLISIYNHILIDPHYDLHLHCAKTLMTVLNENKSFQEFIRQYWPDNGEPNEK